MFVLISSVYTVIWPSGIDFSDVQSTLTRYLQLNNIKSADQIRQNPALSVCIIWWLLQKFTVCIDINKACEGKLLVPPYSSGECFTTDTSQVAKGDSITRKTAANSYPQYPQSIASLIIHLRVSFSLATILMLYPCIPNMFSYCCQRRYKD